MTHQNDRQNDHFPLPVNDQQMDGWVSTTRHHLTCLGQALSARTSRIPKHSHREFAPPPRQGGLGQGPSHTPGLRLGAGLE